MPPPDRTSGSQWARSFALLPRFRFSLWRLLLIIIVLAIILCVAVTLRDFIGVVLFALVSCVLPTPLVICALFGRRDVQAFAVGALVPWGVLLIWLSNLSVVAALLWLLVLPVVCGGLAVVTRRWLSRMG